MCHISSIDLSNLIWQSSPKSQNYVVSCDILLVYNVSIFRVAFSHQRKDVISDNPLGETDLTVAEVV